MILPLAFAVLLSAPARAAVDEGEVRLLSRAAAIAWTPESTARFIAAMPKVETHLHLDGSLTQERLAELAREQDYAPLAGKNADEIRAATMVTTPRGSLADVLSAFYSFYPLLQSPRAMEAAAEDVMAAARRENVRYVEVRFAPALQATPSFPMEEVLKSVLRGLDVGARASGGRAGVIICLFRPLPRAQNESMFELAAKYAGRGVVGIDLAGDEAKNPLSQFADFYERAKALGLHTTVHAGEVAGSGDLELALKLGVDRISHATLLAQKPDLVAEIARRGLPIEVNLTSNLRTGAVRDYASHPAKGLFEAGVPITLSTDDPGVFGNTLSGEYQILADELGFSPAEIIAVDLEGVNALFLPDADKASLRAQFESEIGGLLGAP